ncbi:hypothetical protein EI648_16010, partial [Salmonella enterica]|nr:hypothetical protein [Salmonella enterica]EBL2634063.1 hypothetical protein [Salmonella enterica]
KIILIITINLVRHFQKIAKSHIINKTTTIKIGNYQLSGGAQVIMTIGVKDGLLLRSELREF